MQEAFLEALVTGYEPLIEALVLPDPNDRHVLAAANVVRDAQPRKRRASFSASDATLRFRRGLTPCASASAGPALSGI